MTMGTLPLSLPRLRDSRGHLSLIRLHLLRRRERGRGDRRSADAGDVGGEAEVAGEADGPKPLHLSLSVVDVTGWEAEVDCPNDVDGSADVDGVVGLKKVKIVGCLAFLCLEGPLHNSYDF